MDTPSVPIRDLARRLLDREAASPHGVGESAEHEAVRVCKKLRISLTRFAGADGYNSLLRRALAVARAEIPSLSRVTIKSDYTLDGFEALAIEEADHGIKAGTALTAHLLWLLVTFIGEPLTLRLVQQAWPNESLNNEPHG